MNENRTVIIEDNLRLVHSCCRRFAEKGIEYDDLFQAGCLGLIKAAKGFDPDRGCMFSTYAVPMIIGEVKRLFRENGTVKVSRSLKERSLNVTRTASELAKTLGREPKLSELAEAVGLGIEETAEALDAARPVLSLSAPSEEDDGKDTDLPVESGEEQLVADITLKCAISSLEAGDRRLIFLRYYSGKTQSETAALLGTTQVQISRREKKILEKLRKKVE